MSDMNARSLSEKLKTLYPYQREGVDKLVANDRYYLADEMGLGKTVQAILAARSIEADWILVVCPASALENWRREFATWWPGKRVAVVSYSKLIRIHKRVERAPWDLVILDEAHYVKSPSAKRSRCSLRLAANSPRSWLLSGTPMPNNPSELWAPVKYLWPEFPWSLGIKTGAQWLDAFCHCTQTLYGPRPYAVKNAQTLKEFLGGVMLRRTWEQVGLDLPPLRVDMEYLEHDPAFATQLEAMLADGGVDYVLEATGDDPHVSRLRHFLGTYKAQKIGDRIAQELSDGQYKKVVVLAYHTDVLHDLWAKLHPFGAVTLQGSTPHGVRVQNIDAFTDDPDCRVFIGQQNAAGIAINLQAAHEIVLVEPSWSPSDNAQAIKRIHRIGQDNPCRARVYAAPGTLDDRIMGVLAQKIRMAMEVGLERGGTTPGNH